MQDNYNSFTGSLQDFATEELVTMYQTSNSERYLEEIIHRNKGLLHTWATGYLNIPHSEMEDLMSEGYMALLKAVKAYKPELGYSFTTLLKTCVKQHYNRLYNDATRKKRTDFRGACSYEELVETNGDNDTAYEDDYSMIDLVPYLLSLNERRKTIVDYLLKGYSYMEISKITHVTPATINFHVKSIRKSFSAYSMAI